jgi:hypothetical protein
MSQPPARARVGAEGAAGLSFLYPTGDIMQKRIYVVLALALAVGMTAAQTAKPAAGKGAPKSAAKSENGPAAGTWQLNLQKSDFGKMPAPKSVKLVITSDRRESLKWRVSEIGPDGKARNESYEGAMDGQPRPVKGGEPGVTLAYTAREDGGVDIAGKGPKGEFKEVGTISEDRNTLTLKGEANGPDGPVTWTQVYDRVGGGGKSAAKKESGKKASAKQ